jgi:hypothetical protein
MGLVILRNRPAILVKPESSLEEAGCGAQAPVEEAVLERASSHRGNIELIEASRDK